MATVNFTIFGERVPRLRKPLPSKPLPSPVPKLQSNPFLRLPLAPRFRQPDVRRNSLFKPIEPVNQPKTDVKRRVKKVHQEESTPYKPKFIPNLPDKILWHIFSLLDYKNQCKSEAVCRRWQKLMRQKHRREIAELSVEMLGDQIRTLHQVSFKRLSITCPIYSFDFLSGVMRRCHLLLERLTCDFALLANAAKLSFETEGHWKYFSGVEHLHILITRCSKVMLDSFIAIESDLFTELTSLTVQIHIIEEDIENVGRLMQNLFDTHSNLCIDLELHASTANKASYRRTKREWYLQFDGKTPIVGHPVLQLHFNSCSVSRSTQMVATLQATMKQRRRKRKVEDTEQPKATKPKTLTKSTVRKVPFIRRMEIAGSFSVTDLMFLSHSQHEELEKQLKMKIPTLLVDTSDVYYFE
ncbi:F-box domain protein [Aphelenchoides besseyi]|nr:F-box domain protein [Aphelenchoides besseyi]